MTENKRTASDKPSHTRGMCVAWDADFRVTFWSERAQKIFGVGRDEVIGKTPWHWMGLTDKGQSKATQVVQRMVRGEIERHILKLRHETVAALHMDCDWYLYAISHDGDKPHAIEGIVRCLPNG